MSVGETVACITSRDGWCETHSTGEGPVYCPTPEVFDQLRRARFHERENYDRWQAAEAAINNEWGYGGPLRAALMNALDHYSGPDDDTVPQLCSWLSRTRVPGGLA